MKANDSVLESIRSTKKAAPCVSIYFNPAQSRLLDELPSVAFYRQLSYARQLLETSRSKRDAADYLKPLWLVARDELLKSEGGTLAVFHSGDVSTCVRLREEIPERTVVANDFHVKPLVKEHFQFGADEIRQGLEECASALSSGQAVTSLFEIAQALKSRRARQLWVAEDITLWGVLNRQLGSIMLHPKQMNDRDGDVLDDLCEWAIDEGAEVVLLPQYQIPGQHPVIALLKDNKRDSQP